MKLVRVNISIPDETHQRGIEMARRTHRGNFSALLADLLEMVEIVPVEPVPVQMQTARVKRQQTLVKPAETVSRGIPNGGISKRLDTKATPNLEQFIDAPSYRESHVEAFKKNMDWMDKGKGGKK